jgi:lipoprotein-anchoring transpeptidase ErfK/SrfK
VCSDDAELAADDPPSSNPSSGPAGARAALPPRYTEDGLAVHYAFVGPDGASGFRDLAHAEDDTPEADLDPGFAVALVEETDAHGRLWGKTTHGVWIALEQLNAVHPLPLHGELVGEGDVGDMGWVLPEHVATYVDPKGTKAVGVRVRFDLVRRYAEERGGPGTGAAMIRVSPDGAPPEWLRDRDVAHPSVATPPDEVGGKEATERWVDVDLAHQTVIAYEGARPVYAALASTGRGPQGSETATPIGVHRIWAKLRASTMGNLGDEDAESRYSIEDVPYVQFFAKGVALHGAFWHHSFGHAHSHGCVNLAPVDARWLFEFTGPRMPVGWSAVLPAGTPDPGTVVRVR